MLRAGILLATLGIVVLLVCQVKALTVKDYHEKLDNQAKGAFIAGYIDGMRKALMSNTDQDGNLKTVETISENLELLDFIEELFPPEPEQLENLESGIFELLSTIDGMKDFEQTDLQVGEIIDAFIRKKFREHVQADRDQ